MGPIEGNPVFDAGTLTATSVLAWYAWHTTYHTIPDLVKSFRDELTVMRCDWAEERTALHGELAAERKQRQDHHVLVVEALHDLARRIPAEHVK